MSAYTNPNHSDYVIFYNPIWQILYIHRVSSYLTKWVVYCSTNVYCDNCKTKTARRVDMYQQSDLCVKCYIWACMQNIIGKLYIDMMICRISVNNNYICIICGNEHKIFWLTRTYTYFMTKIVCHECAKKHFK
jgi:hypothetical protein